MIYLVHGEDTSKSRALVVNQQKKLSQSEKVALNIKNSTAEQLYEYCVSGSLFGESPLVVFDITEYKKGDVESYIERLAKIPETTTLILFSSKSLGKSNPFIKAAGDLNAKVIENSTFSDANVFKFIDALYSKDRTHSYAELNKLTQNGDDPFYIFSMVLYGLRTLAKILWNAPSVSSLKPFQAEKSKTQLRNFSPIALKSLFSEFFELDKKVKTGEISVDLMLTVAVEKVLNSK